MSMSTFQKVTLVTCLVLCVALLLPKMLLSRGKKDAANTDAGPGRFPPMVHRQMPPDSHGGQRAAGTQSPRQHNTEAIARAKGGGTGAGTGGKSNLAGQIIPIYGFGILMYILYILFKITSKGNTPPTEPRFPSVRSENLKRKITDFELSQLQEKLKETEMVMEKIVSKASHSPERVHGVSADQEETLLIQLREITRVMQNGHLMEGVVSEKKAQQWEGFSTSFSREAHQCWEESFCGCHYPQQSGPEEAEPQTNKGRAGQEEGMDCKQEGVAGQEEGVGRKEEGVAGQEEGMDCQQEGVAGQEEATGHQEEGVAGQAEGVGRKEEGVAGQEEGMNHQKEGGADLKQYGAVDETRGVVEAGVLDKSEGDARTIHKDGVVRRDDAVPDAREDMNDREEEGAENQAGEAADEMVDAAAGPELTTKMVAMQESEELITAGRQETSTSRNRVRRRHKKKRTA